jgi:AraC-like DNA-binding protein
LDERSAHGTISTDLVRILLGGAPLGDGELAEILRLAGIDPALLGSSHRRISARQLAVAWTALEQAADDPNLGLHLGELRDGFPPGHVLFSAMLNSPTLGQALQRYCRFHDLMGDPVEPVLTRSADHTLLRLRARAGVTLHRQHVECLFCLLVSILSQLSGARFEGQVRFAHPRPDDISEHLRIFGPGVHFAQPTDELAVADSYLERPITAADTELLGVLERYAERLLDRLHPARTWSARVAELLGRALCDGNPGLGRVARQLGVSQRSLQDRLRREGTSYQAVLDSVRKQLATAHLLEGELSLAEIAFLLGYADQSAFTHAFRKWTGTSPTRYRECARPAVPAQDDEQRP